MFKHIVRHEWRMLFGDRALSICLVLFSILMLYGIVNGNADLRAHQQTAESFRQEEQKRLAGLRTELIDYETGRRQAKGFLDPRGAASIGTTGASPYLSMPFRPLAAFSVGQSDLLPFYFRASLASRQSILSSDALENPVNLLTGRFDAAFVIVYLFPLLVMGLSYNMISSEKEGGTLAMCLSQPVSLPLLISGKILVRFGALSLVAVGLCLLGAFMTGVHAAQPLVLLSLLLWMGVAVCYGAFWFALSAAVNAFGKDSSTNAVWLAALWLLLVLLIPSFLSSAAVSLYPVPSRVQLIQATRSATKDVGQRSGTVLARFLEDHPDLAPSGEMAKSPDFASTTYAVQQQVEEAVQPIVDRYDQQLSRQQNLIDRFRFLSPAILAQLALNDVSGTGSERYRSFVRQVDGFLREWRDYFLPRVYRRVRLRSENLNQLPRFTFQDEPLTTLVNRIAIIIAAILLLVGAVGILSFRLLRRYPVTA